MLSLLVSNLKDFFSSRGEYIRSNCYFWLLTRWHGLNRSDDILRKSVRIPSTVLSEWVQVCTVRCTRHLNFYRTTRFMNRYRLGTTLLGAPTILFKSESDPSFRRWQWVSILSFLIKCLLGWTATHSKYAVQYQVFFSLALGSSFCRSSSSQQLLQNYTYTYTNLDFI